MTTCWKPKPDLYTHFLKVSRSLPSFMWRKYIESSKEFPTLLMNQKVSPMHHLCCPPWVVSPPIDQHLQLSCWGTRRFADRFAWLNPWQRTIPCHGIGTIPQPTNKPLKPKNCIENNAVSFWGGLDACYGWKKKLPKHLRRSVGPLLRFQTEASKESHSLSLRRRPSVGST